MSKIAIIGAGASGLICSIFCAKKNLKVDVFEQNSKCAKKILVSGNGRCNITNRDISQNDYAGLNPAFVVDSLNAFGFNEFEKFASSIGLVLHVKDDGRAYPLSQEAKSVAMILESYATSLGVVFHKDTKITDVEKLYEKYDEVVIATGSKSASHLGGCDDGYEFAKVYGHNIIPTYPALVQLHVESNIIKKMSGVKISAEVTLLINKKKDSSVSGDILFTNYGVSGFAILDISQRASEELQNYSQVSISINLLPSFTAQKLSHHITALAKNLPHSTLLDILIGLVPIKIATSILENLNLENKKALHVGVKDIKKIANLMLNWRFEISDTHGFRHSEVSGGGVDTSEINSKTFESKLKKNLYFCGEVLDIVGNRGGYNFAFAWASGFGVAKAIQSNIKLK